MSIYATLWQLKFPRYGEVYTGTDWVLVAAQGVPDFIGSPAAGYGYEQGDPYGAFLPPPIETPSEEDRHAFRAVVFVTEGTRKGTARSGQEYENPLLVMTGQEYAAMSIDTLHARLCEALRGDRPRRIGEHYTPHGVVRVLFEDGSSEEHRVW